MIDDRQMFVPILDSDMEIVSDREDFIEQPSENFEQPPKNHTSETLICSHCKKEQPLTEFYVTTNYYHEKRGRTYRCKTCSRESARESAKKRKKVKDEVVLPSGQ